MRTSNNPSTWPLTMVSKFYDKKRRTYPAAGKEEDVDTNKCDQCVTGSRLARSGRSNTCNNELGNTHADSTKHQKRTSTPSLHEKQPRDCTANIDNTGDDARGKGVVDPCTYKVSLKIEVSSVWPQM